VSCATCHDRTRGFTDQIPVSEGIGGQFGKRNAPTVLNTALLQTLFWDGRSPTLDHQARLPILNPIEMGMPNEEAAMKAIRGIPEYQEGFKKAFGREMNYEDLGKAIGAFERTLVFAGSPFRRFLGGDQAAISPEAQAGWELFNGKARCMTCHPMNPSNPLGTDNRFHNVGVSARHQDFEGLARKALKAMQEDASEQKLRRAGHRHRHERAGPLHGDPQPCGHRLLPHAHDPEHRHHGALHARRLAGHPVGT
jgi:cytochrome c peroxidase